MYPTPRTDQVCIMYRSWGGPEKIELVQPSPKPGHPLSPGKHQIVVSNRAISINPLDWKIMNGGQKLLTLGRLPRVFGTDFAGVVAAAGRNSGFREGDRVMGMVSPTSGGSGCSVLRVPGSSCARIPEHISFTDAAGLPAAGISAIMATEFMGSKAPGRVLLTGACGGVGSLALQLLRGAGWEVHAPGRSGKQTSFLKKSGVFRIFGRESWEQEIDGERWDAIVDGPGVLHGARPHRMLAAKGVYAPVYIPDALILPIILSMPIWWIRRKSHRMFLAIPTKKRMELIHQLVSEGTLQPVTDSIWPREKAREALEHAMSGQLLGKVIINWTGETS